MLKDIFHSVKQSPLCEINFTDLRDDIFSHNRLVTKFLPTYRNLYLTKTGIGGNNFKKHVYYPAYVLNMSVHKDIKIFQIRVGVEEDISTEPLCYHAKIFLKNLLKNSTECIKRFNEMNGDWFLIHGQDRQKQRESIPLKDLSLEKLEQICNLYLLTENPADIAIGHNYYWGEDTILTKPTDFISSLASDLNHLNYFFELAHE